MTGSPNRRSGGAGVRTGGVSMGTDAHQYTNAVTARQGRFVAWTCKVSGVSELRICAPAGATRDEITHDLARRYLTRTVERVEPIT